MAQTEEDRALKAITKSISSVTFNFYGFGQGLMNYPPAVQRRMAYLFYTTADLSSLMSDYGMGESETLEWYRRVSQIPLTLPSP